MLNLMEKYVHIGELRKLRDYTIIGYRIRSGRVHFLFARGVTSLKEYEGRSPPNHFLAPKSYFKSSGKIIDLLQKNVLKGTFIEKTDEVQNPNEHVSVYCLATNDNFREFINRMRNLMDQIDKREVQDSVFKSRLRTQVRNLEAAAAVAAESKVLSLDHAITIINNAYVKHTMTS